MTEFLTYYLMIGNAVSRNSTYVSWCVRGPVGSISDFQILLSSSFSAAAGDDAQIHRAKANFIADMDGEYAARESPTIQRRLVAAAITR
mgnify:CR=1 FL=1